MNKLFLGIMLLQFISHSYTDESPIKGPKRVMKIYYETLCPPTLDFFNGTLNKAMNTKGFQEMVDLEFIPYGFTWFTQGSGTKLKQNCHHGISECMGNNIHICALTNLPKPLAIKFIQCTIKEIMPKNNNAKLGSYAIVGRACATSLDVTPEQYKNIDECAINIFDEESYEALIPFEEMTTKANIKYTPWITVDDQWSKTQDYEVRTDMVNFICHVYYGVKPDICGSYGINKSQQVSSTPIKKIKVKSKGNDIVGKVANIVQKKLTNDKLQLLKNVQSTRGNSFKKIKENLKVADMGDSRYTHRAHKDILKHLDNHTKRVNMHIKKYMLQTDKLIKLMSKQLKLQNKLSKKNWKGQCKKGEMLFGEGGLRLAQRVTEYLDINN